MKLPHITVEYREDDSFALGKMSLELILGFGVACAWFFLLFLDGSGMPDLADEQIHFTFIVGAGSVFMLTLASYSIFLKQARALFSTAKKRRRNRLIAATAETIGTLLLMFIGLEGAAGTVCLYASIVACGFGAAVLTMSFAISCSVLDIIEATVSSALAVLLGAILYGAFVLLGAVSAVFCIIFTAFAPALQLICLNRCSAQLVDNLEFSFNTLPVRIFPFAIHVCIPALAVGPVIGIIESPLSLGAFRNIQAPAFAGYVVLAGLIACIFIVIALISQRHSNNFMFRTMLPVVGVILLFVQQHGEFGTAPCLFSLFLCFVLLWACIWVFSADISQRFRISGFTTFGLTLSSVCAGILLGLITSRPEGFLGSPGPDTAMMPMVMLVLLLIGFAFLPKSAELRRTLKHGSNCPALYGDERFFRVSDEEFARFTSRTSDEALENGEDGSPARNGEGNARIPVVPPAGTGAPTEGASPVPEAIGGPVVDAPALSADRAPVPSPEDILASPDSTPEELQQARRTQQGRFKRKCMVIAETYQLSAKETEVLFQLAKGFNSAAIQERLYISAGTANTHMRHIYRKLGVHSQQELMALVDSVEDVD